MSGKEKRRERRLVVNELFSLFVMIEKKQGQTKIYMNDLSRGGIAFEVSNPSSYHLDEQLALRLYSAHSFFLPINAVVKRVSGSVIALEFTDPKSDSVIAVGKLIDYVEAVEKAAVSVVPL